MLSKTQNISSLLAPWITRCLDPDQSVDIDLHGLPARIRIPANWSVKQKFADQDLCYFVEEGSFLATIAEKDFQPQAGDFLLIPAGNAFHFRLPPSHRLVIYRFRLSARPSPKKRKLLWLPGSQSSRPWIEQIAAEAAHADKNKADRLRGLLLCLFTELERSALPRSKEGLSRTQQETLLHFVSLHPASRPNPAALAKQLQLSHDYFTRLFHKSFQKTPRRWLLEQRIKQAELRLIESTLNISQIADEIGYKDLFLFSRQFKLITGLSPVQYRRQRQ